MRLMTLRWQEPQATDSPIIYADGDADLRLFCQSLRGLTTPSINEECTTDYPALSLIAPQGDRGAAHANGRIR